MDVQCAGFVLSFVSSLWSGRVTLFKAKKMPLNCDKKDETWLKA